jgi:hypothetical protein
MNVRERASLKEPHPCGPARNFPAIRSHVA